MVTRIQVQITKQMHRITFFYSINDVMNSPWDNRACCA